MNFLGDNESGAGHTRGGKTVKFAGTRSYDLHQPSAPMQDDYDNDEEVLYQPPLRSSQPRIDYSPPGQYVPRSQPGFLEWSFDQDFENTPDQNFSNPFMAPSPGFEQPGSQDNSDDDWYPAPHGVPLAKTRREFEEEGIEIGSSQPEADIVSHVGFRPKPRARKRPPILEEIPSSQPPATQPYFCIKPVGPRMVTPRPLKIEHSQPTFAPAPMRTTQQINLHPRLNPVVQPLGALQLWPKRLQLWQPRENPAQPSSAGQPPPVPPRNNSKASDINAVTKAMKSTSLTDVPGRERSASKTSTQPKSSDRVPTDLL